MVYCNVYMLKQWVCKVMRSPGENLWCADPRKKTVKHVVSKSQIKTGTVHMESSELSLSQRVTGHIPGNSEVYISEETSELNISEEYSEIYIS